MRVDKSYELSELEDLKQKMAAGKQKLVQSTRSPPAKTQAAPETAEVWRSQANPVPKPMFKQDFQPQTKISFTN